MEEDELVSEEEEQVQWRRVPLRVSNHSSAVKGPRSDAHAKKNTTVDRQRKRQKRKEDENQLGIRRKAMDKAKVRTVSGCLPLFLTIDCRLPMP